MLKKSLVLTSLTLLLAVPLTQIGGLSASANTRIWHNGSPKALRGNWSWQRKHMDPNLGDQYSDFTFTKSGFTYGEQGEPGTYSKYAKYRSLGHGVYKIHAYTFIEALKTKGVWKTYTIKKGHHKIRAKESSKFSRYVTYHRGNVHFESPKR